MSTETTPSTVTDTPSTSTTTDTLGRPPRIMSGGCLCKSIRYRIAREECQERMNMSMSEYHSALESNGRCHCGTCQTFTGSAFSIGLLVPEAAFSLDDPGQNLRTYQNIVPESGGATRVHFCSRCGCYLFHDFVLHLCVGK